MPGGGYVGSCSRGATVTPVVLPRSQATRLQRQPIFRGLDFGPRSRESAARRPTTARTGPLVGATAPAEIERRDRGQLSEGFRPRSCPHTTSGTHH